MERNVFALILNSFFTTIKLTSWVKSLLAMKEIKLYLDIENKIEC